MFPGAYEPGPMFCGTGLQGFWGYKQEESRGTFVTLSWANEGDILGEILPDSWPISRSVVWRLIQREAIVNGDDVWPFRNPKRAFEIRYSLDS
jgi:hypothetical protein